MLPPSERCGPRLPTPATPSQRPLMPPLPLDTVLATQLSSLAIVPQATCGTALAAL